MGLFTETLLFGDSEDHGFFSQTNNHTAWTVLYAPNLKHCQEKTKKYDFIITIPQKQVILK